MRSALSLALLSALCALSLAAQPAPPRVRVEQGELAGAVTPVGTAVFKGIPYAAPPVGILRWREPQPPVPWAGVRQAVNDSAICTQPGTRPDMSEDCLYLNIWTPTLSPSIPAPVVVFIHGGGFTQGSASHSPGYDGADLALRGAVVVTINYRLGVFGFLAHPDLTRESPHHASGNYALMDQLAALRWVRKNITAFGGDAHNLTVFGESAGATSIGYLMISPLAVGAFDKAILESPSDLYTPDQARSTDVDGLTSMEALGLAITPHIADLRALSSEEVLKESAAAANTLFAGPGHLRLRPGGHTQNPKNIGSPWWPNVDGYVIPAQHALLYEEGRGMRIPVMAGTNTDEGASFLHHFPPQTVSEYNEYVTTTFAPCGLRIMAQYPAADPHAVPAAAQQLVTDAFFLYGAFSVARAQHGYLYRFSHAAGHGGGIVGHGAEMVYIFGHTRNYPALFDEADHRLADRMMTTWVHFARTGDPRLMESSDWTRIGSNGEVPYMDFGTTPTVKDLPDTSLRVFRDLWPPSGKPSQCSKR